MKLLKYILYISPLLIFIGITTSRELGKGSSELGSKKNPIKFYFTPSVDASKITTSADKLIAFLEKETGYHFVSAIPADYVTVVESFGSGKADIAIVNTFSYLLANEKYGTTARLRVIRGNGETYYAGCLLVKSDSGIDSLSQLNGKKVAFVDPSSTSGYILPKALLKKNNVNIADEVFAKKHDIVVTMIYQNQVDAGATYFSPPDNSTGIPRDARERVITQYPDVFRKIKVLTVTEKIPNDPVMFRKDLPENLVNKVTDALFKFVSTEEGMESLYEIYSVRGLTKTKDSDYDVLRDLLKRINFKIDLSNK